MKIIEANDFSFVGLVIALAFFGLIAYDIYLYKSKEKPTISTVLKTWAWYKPWIPFVAGFLCGHWFW